MTDPRFTDTPTGYRDLYWCWHLNEPIIIEYRVVEGVRESVCNNCGANLIGDSDGHTFIAHVKKPGPNGAPLPDETETLTVEVARCYGCPFMSRASETDWYCGAKTVATNGETWRLPPESATVGADGRRPEWCPLPAVVVAR